MAFASSFHKFVLVAVRKKLLEVFLAVTEFVGFRAGGRLPFESLLLASLTHLVTVG